MEFDIAGNPDFGDLTVRLDAGETIWAESGAMSRMSSDLQVQGRLIGGLFQALARKLVGGESLFLGTFAAARAGDVSFSPRYPGSILHRPLTGEPFYLTGGSFLACTPGVTLNTRFGGLRAFFSGEGAFLLECTGHGDLFFSSMGGVIEREVDGSMTVDTSHLVGWEPSPTYTIGGMGGLKQTLFSGEGLVMNFTGHGRIYLQTRHLHGVVKWLAPYCVG